MTDRACLHCGGPHPVSDRVAEESPFCATCLPERVRLRSELADRDATIERLTAERDEARKP